MQTLVGVPFSEGIAIGPLFVLEPEEKKVPTFSIALHEVDAEIRRYRTALFSSREDLKQIQAQASSDVATLIDSHLYMLEDPLITEQMEEKIRCSLQNPESVFQEVIHNYGQRFSMRAGPFFQERLADVKDLAQRVLRHLSPSTGKTLSHVPVQSIVFAQELVPSQIASCDRERIGGFITKNGGGHSHGALIARSKGIPCVGGIDLGSDPIDCVILDAQRGEVILNPNRAVLRDYQHRQKSVKVSYHKLQAQASHATETNDGYPLSVSVNLGNPLEWEEAKETVPAGVGLFRSEYLLLQRRHLLSSEEEQYQVYQQLVHSVEGRPVVIRVFDVGGDKSPQWMHIEEPNPVLGCRGIRFLLRHPDLFTTQLRALLRAAVHGDVRILLPLISDLEEIALARRYLEEASGALLAAGIPHRGNLPLGCMVELPSAALLSGSIARHCDFLSIGTNDLVQYTLGVDRNHPSMGDRCDPAHPALIRMIKMVASQAHREGKEVTVCGEIASNPLFIPLLIGCEIQQISCAPRYVPLIKRSIRSTSFLDAYELTEQLLTLETAGHVRAALTTFSNLSSH